jgi:transcriptional antiterminator NusG
MEEQNTVGTSSHPGGGEGQTAPAESLNPNMRWYIIHTYSGFEKKVKESLESRVVAFGLQEKIGKVVIPTEPVTEIRGGKKYSACFIRAMCWCKWT